MKITRLFVSILFLLSLFTVSFGTVAVKVFSYDEGLSEENISKPRIMLTNVGTEAITNIVYDYYFTCERDEVPVADDYWTPEEDLVLVSQGNNHYKLRYIVSGTLQPGQSFPENSGNVLGIHYNTWSTWDKTNDYSNSQTSSFVENTHIVVYVNGVNVYGVLPDSVGGDAEPESALEFHSFALYATDSANVKSNTTFSGGGAIGSNVDVTIGSGSTINGNVISASTMSLQSNTTVNGDVYVKGFANLSSNITINGVFHENAQVATLTIPTQTFSVGTADQTIASNSTVTLQPGNYRNVVVNAQGTLLLLPGTYTFNQFLIMSHAKVQLDAASSQAVNIKAQSELEFLDSSEVVFLSHAYAPALQIYTNDTSGIKIGTGTKIVGILSAPYGRVTVNSGAQCDGAVYAKKITVESSVNFSSSDVDPLGDPDNDGIVNILEGITNTDPLDSLSFKMMAIPDLVILDTTSDLVVSYNVAHFAPEYSEEDQAVFTIPAGTLALGNVNVLWSVSNTATDFDGNSLSSYFLPNGYSLESRFFSFAAGTFKSNAFIDVTLPVIASSVAAKQYSIYYLTEDATTWSMVSATSTTTNGNTTVSATIRSPLAMVIVAKRDQTTAYLDGMVFVDNLPQAQVGTSLTIESVPDATTGSVTIEYVDMANASVTASKTVTMVNAAASDGVYNLTAATEYNFIHSAQNIVIKKINITTSTGLDYVWTGSYTVVPGVNLTLHSSCPVHYFASSLNPIAFESASNFTLESIDIDGEGRARPALDGSGFAYDYYITDHLGSTREVINSTGNVTEATMYYPYGKQVILKAASSTDNAREKFTGKELDAGENPAGEAVFNITITDFDAGRHYRGELWVNYIDESTNRAMTKVYSMFYNTTDMSFTLNTTERFPTDIHITGLKIYTSGVATSIAYDKTCNYYIQTDHGLTISLQASGADLINNSSTNYFTTEAYTPERVAGSNLVYFGARYYDPEVGMFSSIDPAYQFWNPYAYASNPVTMVDPNGAAFAVDDAIVIGVALIAAYIGISSENQARGMTVSKSWNIFSGDWWAGAASFFNNYSDCSVGGGYTAGMPGDRKNGWYVSSNGNQTYPGWENYIANSSSVIATTNTPNVDLGFLQFPSYSVPKFDIGPLALQEGLPSQSAIPIYLSPSHPEVPLSSNYGPIYSMSVNVSVYVIAGLGITLGRAWDGKGNTTKFITLSPGWGIAAGITGGGAVSTGGWNGFSGWSVTGSGSWGWGSISLGQSFDGPKTPLEDAPFVISPKTINIGQNGLGSTTGGFGIKTGGSISIDWTWLWKD